MNGSCFLDLCTSYWFWLCGCHTWWWTCWCVSPRFPRGHQPTCESWTLKSVKMSSFWFVQDLMFELCFSSPRRRENCLAVVAMSPPQSSSVGTFHSLSEVCYCSCTMLSWLLCSLCDWVWLSDASVEFKREQDARLNLEVKETASFIGVCWSCWALHTASAIYVHIVYTPDLTVLVGMRLHTWCDWVVFIFVTGMVEECLSFLGI